MPVTRQTNADAVSIQHHRMLPLPQRHGWSSGKPRREQAVGEEATTSFRTSSGQPSNSFSARPARSSGSLSISPSRQHVKLHMVTPSSTCKRRNIHVRQMRRASVNNATRVRESANGKLGRWRTAGVLRTPWLVYRSSGA